MRKVLIETDRTWVLLDRIGTVRNVLLELIGSDRTCEEEEFDGVG